MSERFGEARSLAFDPSKVAWGGIGGSGKHGARLLPEAVESATSDPKRFRQTVEEALTVATTPQLEKLLDRSKVAWGGIGGSGKHAAELVPEEEVGR